MEQLKYQIISKSPQILIDLIESSREAFMSLRAAADSCHDANLKNFFTELANERACFGFELEGLSDRHNSATFFNDEFLSAPVSRGRNHIQYHQSSSSDQGLLEEYALAEANALEQYRSAIAEPGLNYAKSILQRHLDRVLRSRKEVQSWLGRSISERVH